MDELFGANAECDADHAAGERLRLVGEIAPDTGSSFAWTTGTAVLVKSIGDHREFATLPTFDEALLCRRIVILRFPGTSDSQQQFGAALGKRRDNQ